MITLYHCNTSYASHKARLYLAEKGLPWHSVHIDLRKQEHISSDYRKVNPNGTVPAMQDEQGKIHCGSTELMQYLEETYPQPSLLPAQVNLQKLVYQICREHEALHDPHLRVLSYHNIFMDPKKRDAMDIKRVLELAKHHPNPARGEFLRRAVSGELTEQEVKSAEEAVAEALALLAQRLAVNSGEFVVDDTYTIADAVCTASIFRIEKVGMSAAINQHPMVVAWYQRMQQRPSFKTAILDWQ